LVVFFGSGLADLAEILLLLLKVAFLMSIFLSGSFGCGLVFFSCGYVAFMVDYLLMFLKVCSFLLRILTGGGSS
jgi:hypothetical protein